MKTTHHYNLDLDQMPEGGTSESKRLDSLEGAHTALTAIVESIPKQFSLGSAFEQLGQDLIKSMQPSLGSSLTAIAEQATLNTKSLTKALEPAIPIDRMREMLSEVKTPSLEIYTEPMELPELPELEIETDDNIPVLRLPENAKWEYVRMRFKSERVLAIAYSGKRFREFDCEELGMAKLNTKELKQNKQMDLLYQIAIALDNKKHPTVDLLITTVYPETEIQKRKQSLWKTKELLTKKLQAMLGIDDDPFLPYDEHMGYQPKFELKLQPAMRNKNPHRSGSKIPDPDSDTELTPQDLISYQPMDELRRNQ